jgi:hypothetical protein
MENCSITVLTFQAKQPSFSVVEEPHGTYDYFKNEFFVSYQDKKSFKTTDGTLFWSKYEKKNLV